MDFWGIYEITSSILFRLKIKDILSWSTCNK